MGTIGILVLVILLIGLSAICSGLNIAVMSLDVTDLQRKAKLGNKNAKTILKLRQNGHLTLAAILLANVAVISATSLVLETRFNGWVAGIVSTLLIVIFGEIIPQAFFNRHALTSSAFFAPFLRFMIIISYPVSKPLQLLLDKVVGPEKEELESRAELGLLIGQHLGKKASELDEDEIEIMRGALTLSEKDIRDIMTPIEEIYWLPPDTAIDESKVDEIRSKGHSRIPVLNKTLTRCYGILRVVDLLDLDFDEQKSFKLEDLTLYPTTLVGAMTALDTLFRKFIKASSHMMPVERDDKIVGVVTIEDLIEEIIGHEIEDEADRNQN